MRNEALQHTGHMKFLVLHPGTEPVKYTDKQQTNKIKREGKINKQRNTKLKHNSR